MAQTVAAHAPDGPPKRFAPRLLLSLIALAMLVALIMLGNWQKRRYYESLDNHARYTSQHDDKPALVDLAEVVGDGNDMKRLTDLQYRRGELQGALEPNAAQLLTARYMFGKRGYGVMMPLRTPTGRYERVLVHLGWVPADKVGAYLREIAASPQTVVKGRFHITSPGANVQPSGELLGHPTWLRVHADAIAKRVTNIEPRLLLQAGKMATGRPILTDQYPIDGYAHPVRMAPSKHVEYAATWYGLGLTLVCVWFALSFRQVPVATAPVR
jgi:surfeit locus 1 family protein